MAHKIAIIKQRDIFYNYGDDRETIINSITSWEEVSDEEFKLLEKAAYRFEFVVIEQPIDTKTFIAKTISDYVAMVKEEQAKEEKAKKARAEAALKRKHAKELKDKESKLALFNQLKSELGVE